MLTEPQLADIDVFYGGKAIATVPATFTATEVRILDSASVAASVPDAIDEAQLAALLSAPLPGNAGIGCRPSLAKDCPLEYRHGVAIVFDRSMLQAELFIASNLLMAKRHDRNRFLGRSNAGFSLVNRLTSDVSGSARGSPGFTINNRALFGWRENHLDIESRLTTDGNFSTPTLALKREFQGQAFTAGRFMSTPDNLSFMESSTLTGLSIASGFNTRTDSRSSRGSPIEVFLPSRSRVEIFRNGQLLDADFYEVGNQVIDTRRLPGGSYTVELKITDAAGNISTTTRYFSRSPRLPPSGQPLYFMNVGSLEDGNLQTTDRRPFAIQAGVSMRVATSVAASIGLMKLDDAMLAEAGLFHQGTNYSLQAGAAIDNEGNYGMDARFRYRLPSSSLNLTLRHIHQADQRQDSLLANEATQLTSSFNFRTSIGTANAFYRVATQRESGRYESAYGLRWRISSTRPGSQQQASFEISRSQGKTSALIRLEWQTGAPGRTHTIRSTLSEQGVAGMLKTRQRFEGTNEDRYDVEWRVVRDQFTSLENRFSAETALGNARWDTRYRFDDGGLEYSGRIATSFAWSQRDLTMGSRQQGDAGFIVTLDGDPGQHTAYPVLVDGVHKGTVRPGRSTFISTNAYNRYAVEVVAPDSVMTSISGGEHQITLYPGNVVNLQWQVMDSVILIGEVVDETGSPVNNALIGSAEEFAMTDDMGRFQLEIDRRSNELVFLQNGTDCRAKVQPPSEGAVGFTGTIRCTSEKMTAAATLPSTGASGT